MELLKEKIKSRPTKKQLYDECQMSSENEDWYCLENYSASRPSESGIQCNDCKGS